MSVRDRHARERSARRNAMVAAAARVFARHGLDGATIEMVAREAEVAVGTIYLYFASRDDLFLSLIAERGAQLRSRYVEIQARKLEPLDELRAMANAYLDYVRESRELFLAQQSVVWEKLQHRLRRPAEQRNFRRVMLLAHEIFGLWEHSVSRVFPQSAAGADGAKIASVLWATLNGAFVLTGDDRWFRGVTGLDPSHFVEEAFEYHLAAAGLKSARGAKAPSQSSHHANGSNGARKRARSKSSGHEDQEDTAAALA
ncbi:MAG: TetR/AcrR family transcriptional regulator [Candidatus Binataceae bacterium]